MKVEYEPQLLKQRPLAEISHTATPILERALGPDANQVTATWGLSTGENGRSLVSLTLADARWPEEATKAFKPEDLVPDRAWERLSGLWGELLHKASDRVLRSLDAALAADEGS